MHRVMTLMVYNQYRLNAGVLAIQQHLPSLAYMCGIVESSVWPCCDVVEK